MIAFFLAVGIFLMGFVLGASFTYLLFYSEIHR